MSTTADLRERFPEVADLVAFPDTLLQRVLDEATRLISVACFTDDMQNYLAMHLLFFAAGPQGAGIKSVSAGQASISYGDAWRNLGATGYGNHFKYLASLCVGARIVSGNGLC